MKALLRLNPYAAVEKKAARKIQEKSLAKKEASAEKAKVMGNTPQKIYHEDLCFKINCLPVKLYTCQGFILECVINAAIYFLLQMKQVR